MLSRIRKDALEARKKRDIIRANLLVTLVAEIDMLAKNDNRPATDDDTLKTIKKFLKGIQESIAARKDRPGDDVSGLEKEKEILESYLPTQLTETQLEKSASEIIAAMPEKSMKMMGKVMAELNSRFAGQIDGKLASNIVKKLLS